MQFAGGITNRGEVGVEAVLRSFAIAELDRLLGQSRQAAPAETRAFEERVVAGTATFAEWQQLLTGIVIARGPLLAFFLYRPTRWHEADCAHAALASVRLIRYWQDQRPISSADVAELLRNEPGEVLIRNFDRAKMRGRPILVGSSEAGPWYAIEGAHRLTTILSVGPVLPEEPVYVGICPSLHEWSWMPKG